MSGQQSLIYTLSLTEATLLIVIPPDASTRQLVHIFDHPDGDGLYERLTDGSFVKVGGAGMLSGGGTLNQVAKFTPDGSTLGNSQIFDNGVSVGINTILPSTKARLEIVSTTQGVLFPKVTTAQRNLIAPALGDAGLFVYNTSTSLFNYWDGVVWQDIDSSATPDGTVTSVSVTTNQGVSGIVTNPTTTPDITLSLGALTGITSVNGLVITANSGIITTGTWNGDILLGQYGGTGVANTGKTLTLGGDLSTTGAFNTVLAQQFSGIITLPNAASTLATLNLVETFTNKTLTSPDINGGTADSLTSLSIRDTSAAFDVFFAATSSTSLSANRTFTVDMNNVSSSANFGTWKSFSGTNNPTGFSVVTTNICRYCVIGKTCFMNIVVSGTSNATTFTLTSPVTSVNAVATQRIKSSVQDNGTNLTGSIEIPANSTTITILSTNGIAFTAAGTKTVVGVFMFEIS